MAIVTPTTELEAVNTILSNIGESPVNTLDDDDVADASIARTILNSVSREVQSRGWFWNTDIQYSLAKTANNELVLPANTARVDTVHSDQDKDLVQRGNRLYDRRNHTYSFTEAVKVDLVVLLDFEDLPETARRYITLRAARVFQERFLGTPTVSNFNEKDEAMALAVLQNDEADTGDYNMISDSSTSAAITQRLGFDRGYM